MIIKAITAITFLIIFNISIYSGLTPQTVFSGIVFIFSLIKIIEEIIEKESKK